ncbi:hypothetical protein ABZ990_24950, partial [Streptomyces sp. NPDC046203]
MRIGLIGTGRIGAFHAAALARHPRVGALVLADADPERAAGVATDRRRGYGPGVGPGVGVGQPRIAGISWTPNQ